MNRIAILTSGGDAPGMNAAIRAVTRTAVSKGWTVYGVREGYDGLINDNITPLGPRDVGGIIGIGGTMLGSSRCPEFKTEAGRKYALETLARHKIEALVVIGGNGSQQGAHALWQEGFPVVGIASTIDNDLYGSDITIGANTAIDVALEAIDRLRVTASSHRRGFMVEVMGRDHGYIALMTGIAGGAEAIVIPEVPTTPEEIMAKIRDAERRGKAHAMIVVAEGAEWNASRLIEHFRTHKDLFNFDMRATILGHVQRGGNPNAFDRVIATRLGIGAVECLENGEFGVLVGRSNAETIKTPLDVVISNKKALDLNLLKLADVLAR